MSQLITSFYNANSSTERLHYALSQIHRKLGCHQSLLGNLIGDTEISSLVNLKADELIANLSFRACTALGEIVAAYNNCQLFSGEQIFSALFGQEEADINLASVYGILLGPAQSKPIAVLICAFRHPRELTQEEQLWLQEFACLISTELCNQVAQAENRQLINQLSSGGALAKLCVVNWFPERNLLSCSAYTFDMFGLSKSDVPTIDSLFENVNPNDVNRVKETIQRQNDADLTHSFELAFGLVLPNGQTKSINLLGEHVRDEVTGEHSVRMSIQDVTEQFMLTRELELSGIVFEHTTEAIMITDSNNQIILVNGALQRLTGYDKAELLGKTPEVFSSGKHDSSFYKNMWFCLENYGVWRGEIYNKRKNGEIFPEELSVTVVRDQYGNISNYVAVFRDISEWKETERRLTFYANKDSMTGLTNRRAFIEQVDHEIDYAKRFNSLFSVLFVHIDQYNEIHDVYGHETADSVVIAISERLAGLSDANDILSSYGSDEFAFLLPQQSADKARLIALKVQQAFEQPLVVNDLIFDIRGSMGIAQYPDSAESASVLLRNANYAMQQAKEASHEKIRIHDSELQQAYLRKLSIRDKLKVAIEEKQLFVCYQPIICAKVQRIEKFEALVRWIDTELGFVSPAEFVPVAEEFGLISVLGQFVLEQACLDLAKLHHLGYQHVSVAINRSINEFRTDNNQVELVKAAISQTGVPAEKVVIEITESVAMSSNLHIKSALAALRDYGVKIALDDFCTGFSSLSNLIDYTADIIKIDKSFVDQILTQNNHSILTQLLVDLADRLGMQVVAEGVEEQAQLERLREFGCQLIQGYFYSPAVPIEMCIELLNGETPLAQLP